MSTSYPPPPKYEGVSSGPSSPSAPHHTLGRDSLDEDDQDEIHVHKDKGVPTSHSDTEADDDMPAMNTYTPSSHSSSTIPRQSAHHRNSTLSPYTDHPGLATPTRILTSAGQYFRTPHIDPQQLSRELLTRHEKIRTKDDLFKHGLIVLGLILSWYLFSTCISVYNKWMFDKDSHNFPFPVFVTSMHMFVQTGLSLLCILLLDKTGKMQLIPRKPNGTKRRPSGRDWVTKVFPCALASALDIGLSNNSLKSITLTLYTMCKSSSLVFVLMFAFAFGLERIRCNLIAVIVVITAGVVMMVAAETKLVVLGAVQVLSASVMGGLRGALTQLLLEKEKLGLSNPVSMILWICPIMGVLLFLSSPLIESWSDMFANEEFHNGILRAIKMIALLIVPGCLAFCMMLSEYALIQRTSVVTLSVAGIFKEVLTVIIASSIFDDKLTAVNVTGLCVALLGIGAYNWIKWKGLNEDGRNDDYERAASIADDEQLLTRSRSAPSGGPLGQEDDEEEDEESRLASEHSKKLRQEEADMDGWGHSGIQEVGGGFYDEGPGNDDQNDSSAVQTPTLGPL